MGASGRKGAGASSSSPTKVDELNVEIGEGLIGYVAATGNSVRVDASDLRSMTPKQQDEVRRELDRIEESKKIVGKKKKKENKKKKGQFNFCDD